MKKYTGINYSYRPDNYWYDETVLQSILRDVKGTQRRKMIKDYYKRGLFQELEETLTKTSLTDEERKRMASIHPMFMGGEYLPEYIKDETEIARIELQSTLADVISIRAKTEEGIITYSVVDEYDESEFELPIDMSVEPFSLQELIEFIDGVRFNGSTGIATCHNESNSEAMDRESLADFTTVNSDIYTELEAHYLNVFKEWIKEGEEAVA
ncbi:hypothetical protein OAH15_00375 [bacterium]|nr:hypothetical protein [bacterium]